MRSKKIPIILFLSLLTGISFGQVAFSEVKRLYDGNGVFTLKIADVNNDGLNDVLASTVEYIPYAVGDDKYPVLIFTQNLDGTLNEPYSLDDSLVYSSASIEVFDFNYDGFNDIIIGMYGRLIVYLQNEEGVSEKIVYDKIGGENYVNGGDFNASTHGDINNDGKAELVFAFNSDDWLTIVNYADTGLVVKRCFSRHNEGSSGAIYKLVIADVNNDGLNDIVSKIADDDDIDIFLQDEHNDIKLAYDYSGLPAINNTRVVGMDVGDVTGDGLNDLAFTGNNDYFFMICPQKDGVFDKKNNISYYIQASLMLEIADLNCDGKNEIIIYTGSKGVEIWESDSTGTFALSFSRFIRPDIRAAFNKIAVGDINNDGLEEVLVAHDTYQFGGFIDVIYNTSKPTVFDTTAISPIADSTLAATSKEHSFFTQETTDTIDGYIHSKLDSFLVIKNYRVESIVVDTLIIRTADLCHYPYKDTIIHSYNYNTDYLSVIDTSLYSSIITCLNCETCPLYFPNSFTPNGDGVNDTFSPGTLCSFETYSLTIHDRWAGNVIFRSDNYTTGWDGTHSRDGNICPVGIYPYMLIYTIDGVEKVEYGTVNLLR